MEVSHKGTIKRTYEKTLHRNIHENQEIADIMRDHLGIYLRIIVAVTKDKKPKTFIIVEKS